MQLSQSGNYYIGTLGVFALTAAEREKILGACGEDLEEEVCEMMDTAEKAAVPKVIFGVFPIEDKGADCVTIADITIVSPLMRKNFDPINRVFPYVATCGTELETWSLGYKGDLLFEYWADEIKKICLVRMSSALRAHIKEAYGLGKNYSSMNPGSIKQWPISGQRELFAILGEETVRQAIGVTLTDSMLMLPSKSVSGIGFSSETNFESCRLCPILKCPNRRASADLLKIGD